MSLIGWLVVGIGCGLVARWISDGRRGSLLGDVVLGSLGALAGGFMFWVFGGVMAGFNTDSLVVAFLGAVAVLLTFHALFVYPGQRS
jgi:uncharacterized membrane protein YeaQ/YmgE (transglycosylase-associated protein family)